MVTIARNRSLTLYVIAFILLLSAKLHGQFHGGDADGLALVGFSSTVCPSMHCNGGEGDGQSSLYESNTISPSFYCAGGDADGNGSLYILASISGAIYTTGGDGDGIALNESFSTISDPIYCQGGDADGNAMYGTLGNVNGPAIYCFGGDHDGAGRTSAPGTTSPPIYCLGGSSDGLAMTDMPAFALGQGLWKGYASSNWNTAANWTNSFIPNESFSIVIPEGCPNYPVLSSDFSINDMTWGEIQCSKLNIDYGASFTTGNDVRINGELIISGQFNHTHPVTGSFQVTGQANVTVQPGGALLIQQ